MNWFNNLSIKYKISAIALIGIVGLVVTFLVSYRLVESVKSQLNHTIDAQLPTLKFINDLQVGFAEVQDLYQSASMARDESILKQANDNSRFLLDSFYAVKSDSVSEGAELHRLQDALKDYINVVSRQTELAVTTGDITSEQAIKGFAEADQLRENYEEMQKKFAHDWHEGFKSDLTRIQERENQIIGGSTVIGLLAAILLVVFSTLIIRLITRVLGNAVTVADKIAGGDLNQEIEVLAHDESGRLMNSLRVMRDSLSAQQIEAQNRDELQSAQAGLNETMRGDQDLDVLAANIIEYLAQATKASIGAFYLLEGSKLVLVASYAYRFRRGGDNSFEIGESVVGQCALERKTFVVTDLPPDYVQVSSGIGQATPTSVIVFPIEQDGQLLGVVELGSFRRFTEKDMEFVERGRDGIAIAINSAQARVRMSEMLQQTRTQADELKQQQEQMELINAELEERSRALDRQKNEILQKNNELERSKKVLMEKSRALEASDRYKTQFLSTMSHELRTPLNSILILSQALMENKRGNLSDKEVQHAHVINSSGSDLLTLINDILDLSKIEEGKLDLVFENTRLKDIAAELTKRFEFIVADKGLEFKVTIADDMPEAIVTDTQRLNQILKNFISNATKFTEKGGIYIDIHRPRHPFVPVHSMLGANNAFVIAVRDTGIGIPKDKQDVIFEAFKQADGTTSRKYGGTGLGLTISRELAGLLGGEISVYSEGPGAGSVFYMVLPLDSESQTKGSQVLSATSKQSAKQSDYPATAVAKEKADILAQYENAAASVATIDFSNNQFSQANKVDRILVVEDDKKFAQILNELILEAGLFCDLVYSGEDALTYLEHYRPQAVILDISLPDVSGWDVLKQIKGSSKSQSIPVYIVSAMPEKTQALTRGAKTFTEKPVSQNDVEDLLLKIKKEIGDNFSRVLLVEDNVILHDAIRDQFSMYQQGDNPIGNKGFDLQIVTTGEEGLQRIRQESFDCLIVDLMLPDMDGIELLSKVRGIPEYANKPIIVFTAQELSAEREFEISKYSDRVIIKSGQAMDRLVQAVSMFLSNISSGTSASNPITPISKNTPSNSKQSNSTLSNSTQGVESFLSSITSTPSPQDANEEHASIVDYAPYREGDLEGCKVLLVDDDIRNIYSLSSVLETNGMSVQTAMSGMEALEKLQGSESVEVVLMDIMMPEMDGYEAIRRIRAIPRYRDLPIIALTAKAMKEDRSLCLEAGANDYLAKPVDTDRLNRILVTWTGRQTSSIRKSAFELV